MLGKYSTTKLSFLSPILASLTTVCDNLLRAGVKSKSFLHPCTKQQCQPQMPTLLACRAAVLFRHGCFGG
jgi:hypothetical protein